MCTTNPNTSEKSLRIEIRRYLGSKKLRIFLMGAIAACFQEGGKIYCDRLRLNIHLQYKNICTTLNNRTWSIIKSNRFECLKPFYTSSTSASLTANKSAFSKEEASKDVWEQKQSEELHYLLIVPIE